MEQEQLGEYRLVARIATGGMAELYLGRREGPAGFRKTVAIKRLLPHLTREPQVVQMFLNEARIASRFEHPNIVQVFDLGQAGNDYFMAMEFLDGRTLAEVLEASHARGELVPLGIAVRVLADALAGLHYAHEARDDGGQLLGVVHRDFNPANVFVTYDGRVKVLDFGIAKIQSLSQQSEPGVLRGKYYYMSPEMVTGQPIDRRADIFATGVMLYEILAGKLPFQANDVRTLVTAIAVAKVSAPSTVDEGVPPALDALCLKLLRKDPVGRPADADSVRLGLEKFLTDANQAIGAPELAGYMVRLFPETDPNRRKIAELRSLDPTPGGIAMRALGTAPPAGQRLPPPAPPPSPSPSGPPAVEPRASPAVSADKPARRWATAVVVPLIVGTLGGAGFYLAERLPSLALFKSHPASPGAAKVPAKPASKPATPPPVAAGPSQQPELDKARAALAKGKLDAARETVEKVIAADAGNAAAHALLGGILLKQRYGQKAEAELRQAIKLAPQGLEAYRTLADLKTEQGDLMEASRALEAAHKVAPQDLDLGKALAALYAQRGEWKPAVALLDTVLLKAPKDAGAWADEGFAQFQLGDDAKAAADLGKALKLDPNLAKSYYYEGFLDYKRGDVPKAVESYRTAAEKDKTSQASLLELAELYKTEHDDAKARSVYQEVLARDPQNANAKQALGK
jgi:serine/threonine protein kinase/Flp pilus assembly protein TadD